MLQTVCKLISAVLVLGLLVSCSGSKINNNNSSNDTSSEISIDVKEEEIHAFGTAKHNKESEMYSKGILIENNINITEKTEKKNGIDCTYLVIDGLKNKDIERAINDRIYSEYIKIADGNFIPPYRGIKQLLKQSKEPMKISIYCYSNFNSNNLLSIQFPVNVRSEDDMFTYSYIVAINFDLATGKELTLADLFFEDTDYISLINAAVDKSIMKQNYDSGFEEASIEYYNDEFSYGVETAYMTAPFKSIKPEQKFYIDYSGNIVLLIDYDTPEFFTNFSTQYLRLGDLNNGLAITGISTDSIFEKSDTVYNLRYKNYDEKCENSVHESLCYNGNEDIKLFRNYTYNSQLLQSIQNMIKEIATNEKYMPKKIKEAYKKAGGTPEYGTWTKLKEPINYSDNEISGDVSVDYSCCGNYTCVTQRNYMYYDGEYIDQVYYYCFKGSDPTPMEIKDFFTEGTDYKSIIKGALIKSLSREEGTEDEILSKAENLAETITGIDIQSNGFYLSFNNQYCSQFVYFRDIGCKNLTILD